jgi:hypothetical protein
MKGDSSEYLYSSWPGTFWCISAVGIELSAKVVVRRNWFCGENGPAAKVALRPKWPLPTSPGDLGSFPGITESAMTAGIIVPFEKSHHQTDSVNQGDFVRDHFEVQRYGHGHFTLGRGASP